MAAKVASIALARSRGKLRRPHLTISELIELLQHELSNGAFSDAAHCLVVLYDPTTERFEDYSAGIGKAGALDLLQTYCSTSLRELAESE